MESLKDTLERATGTTAPTRPNPHRLMSLPSTDSVLEKLDAALARNRPMDIRRLERVLEDCRLRDELVAGRPANCWCLGFGEPRYMAGIPNAGQPYEYCPCPEGQERALLDYQKGLEQRKSRIGMERRASWAYSGIPGGWTTWRLETSPQQELAAKLKGTSGSVYLWGEYGRGKTGLAVGLAYHRLMSTTTEDGRAPSVLYRPTPDLLSDIRATYNDAGVSEGQVIDRYSTVDILILDDLGAEQMTGSGWVEDRFYQIIGRRHREGRDTLMTSNISTQQLAERIGERIVWRIVEMCGEDHIIHVEGENQRALR